METLMWCDGHCNHFYTSEPDRLIHCPVCNGTEFGPADELPETEEEE